MREHTEKLMVKISAPLTVKKDTAALDIVFVLDTSGSMGKKNKLVLMQHAMNKFITEKLGKADSLTIIPFASAAAKKEDQFYGRTMKDDAVKKAAKDFVGKLKAGGDTNIKAGLEAALDYLDHGRRGSSHYAYCIFLMSDGHENVDKARSLLARVAKHSVVTFGFGENSDEKVSIYTLLLCIYLENYIKQISIDRSCSTTLHAGAKQAHTIMSARRRMKTN